MKLCLWPNSSDVDPTARRRPWQYGRWGQRGKISQERVPPKHCRYCGDPIPPKSRRRSYCGADCAEAMTLRIVWGYLRAAIIRRDELCRLCGGASYKPYPWGRWMAERDGYTRIEPEWHVDHVLPIIEGGTDDPANLRLLCGRCHKRVTREWRRARARGFVAAGLPLE